MDKASVHMQRWARHGRLGENGPLLRLEGDLIAVQEKPAKEWFEESR